MANFLSQTYIPQETRQDTNFPLLAQIMQMKQGKYDANRAKVQQTLDAFGLQSQQLLRDEDKEYVHAKLSDITSKINAFGNKDLSQLSVTEDLTGMIRTVASDPIIQNAIQNTQKFNNFNKGVATLKEKDPDLYSDINYQYAIETAGVEDYINGKTNTIGNLNYSPYVDYNSEVMKKLKEVSSIKGGKRTMQIRDIDGSLSGVAGTIINKEIDGLTQAELRTLVPTLLDGRMKKQMQIDGYFRFGGDKNKALEQYSPFINSKIERLDTEEINLKSDLEADNISYEKYETAFKQIQDQKANLNETLQNANKMSVSQLAGYMEEISLTNNMAESLYAEENITYIKDGAYFSNLEVKEKQREDSYSTTRPDITSIAGMTQTPDGQLNEFDYIKSQAQDNITTLNQNINGSFSNLSEADKAVVNAGMADPKYSTYSENIKKAQVMLDKGLLEYETEGFIRKGISEYKAYLEDDNELFNETLINNLSSKSVYENLTDTYWLGNSSIKIFDEKTNSNTNYKTYLENRGIKSEKDYMNFLNTKESKDFKARFLSDMLLSSSTESGYAVTPLVNNNLGDVLNGREAGAITEDVLLKFDYLTSVLGEELTFTDVFQVSSANLGEGRNLQNKLTPVGMEYINEHKGDIKEKYVVSFKNNAINTETYKILSNVLKNETYDTSTALGELLPDNSVQDDPTLRNTVSVDNFKKEYGRLAKQKGVRYVKGTNTFSITPTTGEKNKIPIFEDIKSVLAQGGPLDPENVENELLKITNGVAISMFRNPNDNTQFILKQADKYSVVPESLLMQYPNLNQAIDFEENGAQIVREGSRPIEINNLKYKTKSEKTNIYLGNKYGFGSDNYYSGTKQGAKQILRSTYPKLYKEGDKNRVYIETLDKALDNSDKFSAKLENYRGNNILNVYYDGVKITDIASNIPREQIEDIIYSDPQIIVTKTLQSILKDIQFQDNTSFKTLYGRLK